MTLVRQYDNEAEGKLPILAIVLKHNEEKTKDMN